MQIHNSNAEDSWTRGKGTEHEDLNGVKASKKARAKAMAFAGIVANGGALEGSVHNLSAKEADSRMQSTHSRVKERDTKAPKEKDKKMEGER